MILHRDWQENDGIGGLRKTDGFKEVVFSFLNEFAYVPTRISPSSGTGKYLYDL